MANIIPKLNLNKTPSIVESNSLVFAKNARVDIDGSIHKDYSIRPLSIKKGTEVDGLVNYGNIFNTIIKDLEKQIIEENKLDSHSDRMACLMKVRNNIYESKNRKIVGIVNSVNEFYLFIYGIAIKPSFTPNVPIIETPYSAIVMYDEHSDKFDVCNCNWNYSGGSITGYCINNLLGEKILNIGESLTDVLVPLKCINLNKSSHTDDESIYTQAPNIPITNLDCYKNFTFTIPNGTYQFFVRYKIRDGFYTDWFPASRELFAGNINKTPTCYGTLKHVNIHKDSDKSFIFKVTHLYPEFNALYKSYQIGFILARDDAYYGRAWKHFDMTTTDVYFDYNALDSEEIEITDFTKPTYQIYNVKNITNFKNKLYISNYIESDFNENLQEYADKIIIEEKENTHTSENYGDYIVTKSATNTDYIEALTSSDGIEKLIRGTDGIINGLFTTKLNIGSTLESIKDKSLENIIRLLCNNDSTIVNVNTNVDREFYGIKGSLSCESLLNIQKYIRDSNRFKNVVFENNNVNNIKVIIGSKSHTCIPSTINTLFSFIYDNIYYLDTKGNIIDNNNNIITNLKIQLFRDYKYSSSLNTIIGGDFSDAIVRPKTSNSKSTSYSTASYIQEINITLGGNLEWLSGLTQDILPTLTTLIPHQYYDFYVHYVKQNGEVTNGYKCRNNSNLAFKVKHKSICNAQLYPIFKNIELPESYVACFFSIHHYKDNISTIFNIKKAGDTIIEGSCIEMNTRLIPNYNDIDVYESITDTSYENSLVDYYDSSDSSISKYFGANGVVVFKKNSEQKENRLAYSVSHYSTSNNDDNIELIKCTPYIKTTEFTDSINMNLLGYICKIYPTLRDISIKYYNDGSNAYYKKYNTSDGTFTLTELKQYNDGVSAANPIGIKNLELNTSQPIYIYSNYNFNYLSLSSEPIQVVKTWYDKDEKDVTKGDSKRGTIWRLIPSLTMSDVYMLESMYYKYPRKTFSVYTKNNITNFENTVRSSIANGDEETINIFKFNADDYYNVPTNKGIIVNMVAIGEGILIHTQDSMFKFTGNNTLTSNEGEISTVEAQPFDTGITELFGSQYGFGGLQNKEQAIITEQGYIFFDSDSNNIYIYTGNAQISKLNDSIEKLFRRKRIIDVTFGNDFYNNRFFVCLKFEDEKYATLSFCFLENVKSFVSLHDFYFSKSFNTKTKCYFISNDYNDITTIDKTDFGYYYKNELHNDSIYPSESSIVKIPYLTSDSEEANTEYYDVPHYNTILDIIYNENYETIKTINSISWCSRLVNNEFVDIDLTKPTTLKMADIEESEHDCYSIMVYSDTCIGEILDVRGYSNNQSIYNPNYYKFPRYNQGKWTWNYFRDIQNTKDIFEYLKIKNGEYQYDDGRQNASMRSDNNSLIEGKYFVVRYTFGSEFKFETITFYINNKI